LATYSYNVGGIVGANNGDILRCYNKANITGSVKNTVQCETRNGGITGANEDQGNISNCYNTGTIYNSNIKDEYSNNLRGNRVGGVIGKNRGTLENSYNIGKVISDNDDNNSVMIGSINGVRNSIGHVNNCYYLKDLVKTSGNNNKLDTDGTEIESEQKENLVNMLNGESSNVWKKDINNINNGYPILEWQ